MKKVPINTTDGCCKTIFARMGHLSWANYLGRMGTGGWDSRMTCVIEIYDRQPMIMEAPGHGKDS